MAALTKIERDALLARAWSLDGQLYPKDRAQKPKGHEASLLRESYFRVMGEYADRLPRVILSVCPFSGEPLKHSFDPWGLDGPWWQADREVAIEEPKPPPNFKVLLGALALHGRTPGEAREPVIPGPEAPFVIPRLLELPGMLAVISRLDLETGDTAFPIGYYSPEEIPPNRLHQFWLQQEHWYETSEGESAWLIANDKWDFDLLPWIKSGKLRWIRPGDPKVEVVDGRNGEPCPYVNLPGDQLPQSIAFGKRTLLDLPDGTPVNPFGD